MSNRFGEQIAGMFGGDQAVREFQKTAEQTARMQRRRHLLNMVVLSCLIVWVSLICLAGTALIAYSTYLALRAGW